MKKKNVYINPEIKAQEKKLEKLEIRQNLKYERSLSRLEDLKLVLPDDTRMWVYLQSFKGKDDILTGKYIYNFGEMNSEMEKAINKVIDYGSYIQEIIEMKFYDFKELYNRDRTERELLDVKYPGIVY